MRRMVHGLAIAAMLGGHAMAQADAIIPPIAPLLATADPAAGESYAKKVCAQCHSLNEGGKAIIGPNLYGVVGGPHAHMPGFNYSDAMKAKQGPWTYDELFAWLTKPDAYAPGTRMAFPGIKNEKLRLDVIAYLRTLSHDPAPLPTSEAQVPNVGQTATARNAP
jgi:cytochrome c